MDLAQHTLCNYLQDIDCNLSHTLLSSISISSLTYILTAAKEKLYDYCATEC